MFPAFKWNQSSHAEKLSLYETMDTKSVKALIGSKLC